MRRKVQQIFAPCLGVTYFHLNTLFSGFLSKMRNFQVKHQFFGIFARNEEYSSLTSYFRNFCSKWEIFQLSTIFSGFLPKMKKFSAEDSFFGIFAPNEKFSSYTRYFWDFWQKWESFQLNTLFSGFYPNWKIL